MRTLPCNRDCYNMLSICILDRCKAWGFVLLGLGLHSSTFAHHTGLVSQTYRDAISVYLKSLCHCLDKFQKDDRLLKGNESREFIVPTVFAPNLPGNDNNKKVK
jgi:hypothetical protein